MLSNKEKRAQYDLYGAEGPRRRNNQYEDEFSEYDYGRGFEGLSLTVRVKAKEQLLIKACRSFY